MTLTLDHIRMTFDGHEVLRDVTVHVDDGRFVSLIGRSGCGKSTLLRVAAGLIEPTAGTKLLLLDEPFGALDALTRLDMQDLLARLHAANGWSTLMVTHDIAEAVRLSDLILVLCDGVIDTAVTIDRTDLDDEGLPRGHEVIERQLRAALR